MRKEFQMNEKQLADLMEASKPVLMIALHCGTPQSPQTNANRAWANLGKEMWFDPKTVEHIRGKGDKYFTAEDIEKPAAKHTSEPWEYGDQSATVHGPAPEFLQVAHFMSEPGSCMQHDFDVVKANAKRAVACVNALVCIKDPAAFVDAIANNTHTANLAQENESLKAEVQNLKELLKDK